MSLLSATDRLLFMHSAHDTVGVAGWPVVLPQYEPAGFAAAETSAATLRVGLVPGPRCGLLREAWSSLQEHLNQGGASCQWLLGHDSPYEYDCLLLLGGPVPLERSALQRIERYCRDGGCIVALGSAAFAMRTWPTFDEDVLGGRCLGRLGSRLTQIEPAETARHHQVLRDVGPFVARGGRYCWGELAHDARHLLIGVADGRPEPAAWLRQCDGQRVFCTSLGHPRDLAEPSFRRLLTNAIAWVCAAR